MVRSSTVINRSFWPIAGTSMQIMRSMYHDYGLEGIFELARVIGLSVPFGLCVWRVLNTEMGDRPFQRIS